MKTRKVIKGGCWSGIQINTRASSRLANDLERRLPHYGFRVAQEANFLRMVCGASWIEPGHQFRTIRGASWIEPGHQSRSACRDSDEPSSGYADDGLRVARDANHFRVIRGASWFEPNHQSRSACRCADESGQRDAAGRGGFRIVRETKK